MNAHGHPWSAAPDPDLLHQEGFLGRAHADRLFEVLCSELCWRQDEITIFGRRAVQPRLTCWYGDAAAVYRYSGLKLVPRDWHPELALLRHKLQEALCCPFNSVLANLYRDGQDCMGWHADDEKELGSEPVIASITLGAARRFLVRSRANGERFALEPGNGSLLVMRGTFQRRFKHSVPRTRARVGPRINLTFRQIEAPD